MSAQQRVSVGYGSQGKENEPSLASVQLFLATSNSPDGDRPNKLSPRARKDSESYGRTMNARLKASH
jgi:hypothetical protein